MPATSGLLRVSVLRVLLAVTMALMLGLTWGGGGAVVEASHTPTVIAKIPTGTNPVGLAVNPTSNRIFVTNVAADSVTVIDGVTNAVLATIAVGDQPTRVAVNHVTNKVYVSNHGSASVSVINGATNTVSTTIPVAAGPHSLGINTSTNKVYVGQSLGFSDNTLTVINGATDTVLTTLSLGAEPGGGVAVNESTNRIFVANGNSDNVSVVNGATDTEIDTDGNPGNGMTRIPVGADPTVGSVDPVSGLVYIPNWGSGGGTTVSVIDGTSYAVLANVTVDPGPKATALLPALNRGMAGSSGSVTLFDTKTNLKVGSVSTGAGSDPNGIAANPNTGRFYVALLGKNEVWAISIPGHPVGPSVINFQGRLTDSSGNPVANGNYAVTFRLYDALTGANLKWVETQTVAVSNSVFSVALGSVNPLEASHFTGDRYLEVQVASDPPLTPRQRFTSVPYAYNAQSLDGVGLEELKNRDGIILHVASAQSCPANFSLVMDVNAGVNGTDATRTCSSTTYTQVFYIGSAQTCPAGWTQADINAAVMGTAPADACYR